MINKCKTNNFKCQIKITNFEKKNLIPIWYCEMSGEKSSKCEQERKCH